MFNVRMCATCCPSGHLCFLHTNAICLSPIHPSFKNWLRGRLIGLGTSHFLNNISKLVIGCKTPQYNFFLFIKYWLLGGYSSTEKQQWSRFPSFIKLLLKPLPGASCFPYVSHLHSAKSERGGGGCFIFSG